MIIMEMRFSSITAGRSNERENNIMYRLAHIFGKTARGHPPVIYLVAPPALRQCGEKLLCYGLDFDRYFGEHAFGKPQFNVVIARFAQRRGKVYLFLST